MVVYPDCTWYRYQYLRTVCPFGSDAQVLKPLNVAPAGELLEYEVKAPWLNPM